MLFCTIPQPDSGFFEPEQCASERFQGALHWVSFTFNDEHNFKLKSAEWDRSVRAPLPVSTSQLALDHEFQKDTVFSFYRMCIIDL